MKNKGRHNDRRRHPRASFNWPVMICGEKKKLPGSLVNISGSGLAIQTNSFFRINEEVQLVIQIIGYDVILSLNGVVVRSKVIKPDKTGPIVVKPEDLKSDIPNQVVELGVRFTETIKDDLKYFTGNVILEWKQVRDTFKYKLKTGSPDKKHFTLPTILAALIFFIAATPGFIKRINKNELADRQLISENNFLEFDKKKSLQKNSGAADHKKINKEHLFLEDRNLQVQNALNEAGYDSGPADGILGDKTVLALMNYQRNNNLPVTGKMDQDTLLSLGISQANGKSMADKSEVKPFIEPQPAGSPQVQEKTTKQNAAYTLRPGDLIMVSVKETKDLDTKVHVNPRGFITLPLLDQVNVHGLTIDQAAKKIETLLRDQYMHDPHVKLVIIRDDQL